MTKVKVLREFRDKYKFSKIYKVGDEVEGFEEARIAELQKRGLVEVIGGMKSDALAAARAAKAAKAAEEAEAAKAEGNEE